MRAARAVRDVQRARLHMHTRTLFSVALVSASIACAGGPDAQPKPAAPSTAAGSTVTARADSVAKAAAPVADSTAAHPTSAPTPSAGSAPRATAPSASASASASDTTRPHLLAGRSKHDSIAFASTVAFGRRMMAKWPTPPTPLPGSILPSHRIVAFYGNPLAKGMGVLGRYPVDEMLAKLDTAVADWQRADPSTPVVPALQLIAVVAQGAPGRDGKYRLRMDTTLIEKVYSWAQRKHALLFLDVQVGWSTIQEELPRLMPFLARPDVHLAIDPEFYMHYGREGIVPSRKLGQMDAKDVNWASEQLRQLVLAQHLPPKVLIIHRFRTEMVLHDKQITIDPHVQIVMDMDGFGPPWQKFESYRDYIDANPVEYTGFKLFFQQDTPHNNPLLMPFEVLQLWPKPLYIQYQ